MKPDKKLRTIITSSNCDIDKKVYDVKVAVASFLKEEIAHGNVLRDPDVGSVLQLIDQALWNYDGQEEEEEESIFDDDSWVHDNDMGDRG